MKKIGTKTWGSFHYFTKYEKLRQWYKYTGGVRGPNLGQQTAALSEKMKGEKEEGSNKDGKKERKI